MALPVRRLLFALLLPLALGTARAADDAEMAGQRGAAVSIDVETTASLGLRTAQADPEALKRALLAYRAGRLGEADAIAATIEDGSARSLLEWTAIRSSGVPLRFRRLDAFLRDNPNYPATPLIRRRAEEALVAEKAPAATVRAFLHGREPVSPAGRVALARALKAEGDEAGSAALARRIWRRDHLGVALEASLLAEFGTALTRDDHRLRTERYLFAGNATAALRNAARVSPEHAALAKARLASAKAKRPLAASAIAAVPAALKDDPSYAFLIAQQARRADKPLDAAKALARVPRDPALLGDGDGWWTERRLIARKLLDAGEAASAYAVVAGHGAEEPQAIIDAEWHAGFIALRFLAQPAKALTHFEGAALQAETPVSVARTAYWQGRALDALGRAESAEAAYARAAAQPVAYYGQLARARLRLPDLPVRQAVAAPLAAVPGYRGVSLLLEAGMRDLAATLLADLAQRLHSTPALEAVAAVAARQGDARLLLSLGKTALHRGFSLDTAAFPITGVPDFPVLGDPLERAIVHAIARQESAFDPAAMSHAGARGLMQMMPATARETARRAGLPFDWARLGRDPHYAARMGAAHLADLLKDWRGSYVLAFAAYNAGSGHVKDWIEAYGDPRRPEIDAIDWIERIPFYETRNYVQRVMENLQVYRQRLNQRTAWLIDHDLKRGGRRE